MKEAFTADELAEIIRELDLPANIVTPDGNESGETISIGWTGAGRSDTQSYL